MKTVRVKTRHDIPGVLFAVGEALDACFHDL